MTLDERLISITCNRCRYVFMYDGDLTCHRRSTQHPTRFNAWCAEGEWRRDGDWTSWYDIMDMEEAVTKELKRDWRGQWEPLDD